MTNLLDDGQFGAPIVLTPFNYKQGYNWGVELTTSLNLGGFTAYGNLALARQQAKRVETAQSLFSQDDLDFIYNHYIHTDHAQFLTASAGVSYQWKRTRFSVDMLAGSGLRTTVNTPNDSTVPAFQQVNLGITQGFTLGPLGAFEARFDIINVANKNYVIRNGERDRRLRRAVRTAAGLLRRAEEGVLSARADVGKELRCWNRSTASSRSCEWAARRSIRCSSWRSSPRW